MPYFSKGTGRVLNSFKQTCLSAFRVFLHHGVSIQCSMRAMKDKPGILFILAFRWACYVSRAANFLCTENRILSLLFSKQYVALWKCSFQVIQTKRFFGGWDQSHRIFFDEGKYCAFLDDWLKHRSKEGGSYEELS